MKITKIETIVVSMPMIIEGSVMPKQGGKPRTKMDTLLVKIETDEGVTGWGEAFSNAGWQSTCTALAQIIAPRVVGKDPSQIAQIQADLHRGLYNTGRSGPTVFAISGLDIALWDIAAKRAGVPLYKLLGGSARATLPAYASLLRYGVEKAVVDKIHEAKSRGYRLIKLHENNTAIVRAASKACGPDVPLMVDCSCPWTVDESIAIARNWADLKLAWIEEPIYPPDDHSGLARLRTASTTPLAAGENISNFMEFKRLLEIGGVSIAQPSITKIGGVTEMRKVFALGEAHGCTGPRSCAPSSRGMTWARAWRWRWAAVPSWNAITIARSAEFSARRRPRRHCSASTRPAARAPSPSPFTSPRAAPAGCATPPMSRRASCSAACRRITA